MVVISFLFVLGTKGRMQPVVMAPKNLHCAAIYDNCTVTPQQSTLHLSRLSIQSFFVTRFASAKPPDLPPLPTVVIGKRDLSLGAHSVQDLGALADAVLLWDIRDTATARESAREGPGTVGNSGA